MFDVNRGVSIHGTDTAAAAGFSPEISGNVITLQWLTQTGSRDVGIWVNYRRGTASPLDVSGNTINFTAAPVGKSWIGIYGLTIDGGRTVTFDDNTINGGGFATTGYYFSAVASPNVTVSNGSISGVTGQGVLVVNHDATWGAGDSQVTVDHEAISTSPGGTGIMVSADSLYPNTAHVTVQNGTISATGLSAVGVYVSGAQASVTMTGVTVDDPVTGVLVDGGSATISGGTIENNDTGIDVENGGLASISGVTFAGNTTDLVIGLSAVISALSNNSFTASTTYIDNQSPSYLDTTDGNSFGGFNTGTGDPSVDLATYYAVEDKVLDGIDYANRGLVRLKSDYVFVTSLSEATTAGAIQRAVDLASDYDTIDVDYGTYTGTTAVPADGVVAAVLVDKPLTLIGPNASYNPLSNLAPANARRSSCRAPPIPRSTPTNRWASTSPPAASASPASLWMGTIRR